MTLPRLRRSSIRATATIRRGIASGSTSLRAARSSSVIPAGSVASSSILTSPGLAPMRRRSRSNPSVRSSRHRQRRSRPDSWIRRRSPASAICWPTTCSTARGWRRIGPPTRCRTMSRRSCTGRCAAPSRSWAHGEAATPAISRSNASAWGVPTMPDGRVASRRCGGRTTYWCADCQT